MVPPSSMAASITRPNAELARRVSSASAGSKTISGWVLPSPACAMTEIITRSSSAIAATFSMRSGSIAMGTPTSSSSSDPRRSTAGSPSGAPP